MRRLRFLVVTRVTLWRMSSTGRVYPAFRAQKYPKPAVLDSTVVIRKEHVQDVVIIPAKRESHSQRLPIGYIPAQSNIMTTYETIPDTDFAKDWWSTDRFRLLPGEEDDHSVFVIDFYDRCKYFGYTKESVFYRAASLATHIDSWVPNAFVMEHAQRVPYTIRCIKSGLNDLQGQAAPQYARCPGAAQLAHSTQQHRPDPELLAT